MKTDAATWTIVAGLLAGGFYVFVSYFATTAQGPTAAATIWGLLPYAAALLGIIWKSRMRALAIASCIAAILAIVVFFDSLREHMRWLYLFQYEGAMAALALTFGASLRGEENGALCTRLAVSMYDAPVDPMLLRYTRRLTAVWAFFFAACAVVSIGMFAAAPIATWSFFADALTPLLVCAMFAGEYVVRQLVLPGHEAIGVARIVRAYLSDTRARKGR